MLGFGGWFGRRYRDMKRRLKALEDASSGPTSDLSTIMRDSMVAHGNIYNFNNNKPVAKYTQKFDMLNTTIPLINGQILTFFVPEITIEYADGDKGSIELPKAKFEETAQAVERAVASNPNRFGDWKPLMVDPEALEKKLAELHEQKK